MRATARSVDAALLKRVQKRLSDAFGVKHVQQALSHIDRETDDYYDAMAEFNQIPGNAPKSIEVCCVLEFLYPELCA